MLYQTTGYTGNKMREKVLLAGDTNTSKTMSLVQLALIYPDRRVVILDPDDGVGKVIYELGVELPNLTTIPVTPDWAGMIEKYKETKLTLTPDDWLCMDMMGRFWDFCQNFYSRTVFGKTPSEHLLALRNQAKSVSFGGFDGLTDWTVIKRLHNEELVDDALLWSPFNVMATTSISTYLPVEKVPKTGVEGLIASEFGVKVEGEKHNVYRFDTIAILRRARTGAYTFKLAKDKGRPVDLTREFDITGSNFWQVYCDYRGVTL